MGQIQHQLSPQIVEVIEISNKVLQENKLDIELKSSSIEEYVKLLKTIDEKTLLTVYGELRDGPSTSLSANALMTRPYIKMLNKKVQDLLFACAEPFSVVAYMLGEKYDHDFLNKALEYLLLSHPHDTINGVTQDKTADDVMYRLNQSLEIANVIYNTACKQIIKKIDLSNFHNTDILLVVFNPLQRERSDIVKACIDTPQEESIWDFVLQDMNGLIYEPQEISRKESVVPVNDLYARPWPFYADRHSFLF